MSTERMTNTFEKDKFYETVGVALRAARKAQGKAIGDLAAEAKLTTSTIQNAESGSSCSLLVFYKIAFALDVNINDLIPVDAIR